jgi:glycosyltransferase involved in cell wall biosynthesis
MKLPEKISLLTDGLPPNVIGGMQQHSLNLAGLISDLGINLDLYHPGPALFQEKGDTAGISKIEEVIVPFPKLDRIPGHYLRESYQYSRLLLKAFKKKDAPDLIIAKGFTAWAFLAEKRKGKQKFPPVAVNFHGLEMYQSLPGFKSKLQSYLLKGPVKFNLLHADYVFSYGGKISDLLRSIGVPTKKILEMPAWLPKTDFVFPEPRPHDKLRFVFLGRWERRKGLLEIMEVLKVFPDPHPFEFHFIGDIPSGKQLNKKGLVFHGPIREKDEIRKLLTEMDVLVCSSWAEGMPNSILEGLQAGLAILATDTGATGLMVSKENGILLEEPTILNITWGINEFLTVEKLQLLKKKMNSREKAKEFSEEKAKINLVNCLRTIGF